MKIVKLTADGWVLHINIQRSWTKNGVVVGCPSEDEVLDCVVDDRALKGQGFCLILALKRAHDLLFTHDLCYIQQNGCDSNKTSERGRKPSSGGRLWCSEFSVVKKKRKPSSPVIHCDLELFRGWNIVLVVSQS